MKDESSDARKNTTARDLVGRAIRLCGILASNEARAGASVGQVHDAGGFRRLVTASRTLSSHGRR
jgi:hypothetical protein